MNIDTILQTFNRHAVQYIMIGGMNFMLRHQPVVTYDVDFWIEDTADNRQRCALALSELDAEWGPGDDEWQAVSLLVGDWLHDQTVFCMLSPHGALDIFRALPGSMEWRQSLSHARPEQTAAGTPYYGLSDEDMLRCQYALAVEKRNQPRIDFLEKLIGKNPQQP